MTESVERRKNSEQRPQRAVSPVAHARRQHAQRNVRIVPEQWRHDSRAHRRAKRLVEIVLKRERALARFGTGFTQLGDACRLLEFKLQQQSGTLTREIRKIERRWTANVTPGDLCFPRGADERFRADLPEERWTEINRIAGEGA
jgi:hypothetical protein